MRGTRIVHRGEVWTADFPDPVRSRPCVLVSREDVCAGPRERVSVVTVTSHIRRLPSHVPLGPAEGIDVPSAANVEDLQTIPKADLDKPVGTVGPEVMREIGERITYALDLPTGEAPQPLRIWRRRLRQVARTWVISVPRSWVPEADDEQPREVAISHNPDGSLTIRLAPTV